MSQRTIAGFIFICEKINAIQAFMLLNKNLMKKNYKNSFHL